MSECKTCGFPAPAPSHAQDCPGYAKQLRWEALRAITRLQVYVDQVGAACREEDRGPTDEEWDKIREMVGEDD